MEERQGGKGGKREGKGKEILERKGKRKGKGRETREKRKEILGILRYGWVALLASFNCFLVLETYFLSFVLGFLVSLLVSFMLGRWEDPPLFIDVSTFLLKRYPLSRIKGNKSYGYVDDSFPLSFWDERNESQRAKGNAKERVREETEERG